MCVHLLACTYVYVSLHPLFLSPLLLYPPHLCPHAHYILHLIPILVSTPSSPSLPSTTLSLSVRENREIVRENMAEEAREGRASKERGQREREETTEDRVSTGLE